MAKKGLMGGAAIARMNFVDTDLDDSDEEYANLSMVGSRGSHFKSVKVGKGASHRHRCAAKQLRHK